MSEERARILQMVSENKIDAQEAARLLGALNNNAPGAAGAAEVVPANGVRWFRVRVTNLETGRVKVNVNLPLSLVKVGLRIGAQFSSDIPELDWDELMTAIQEGGAAGKLVEVEDLEDGEKVEVYVD
jgi:hypothetical protein